MEKRVILAIVLSLGIWIGWTFFVGVDKKPQIQNKVKSDISQESNKSAEILKTKKDKEIKKQSYISIAKNAKEEKSVEVVTSIYKAKLSNRGAKIESFKYGKRNIELIVKSLSDKGVKGDFDFPIYFDEDEFFDGSLLDGALWSVNRVNEKEIIFSINSRIANEPVVIEKIYSFNEKDFYFTLSYRVKNAGRNQIFLPSKSILIGSPDFLGPEIENYSGSLNVLSSMYMLNGEFEKGTKGGGGFGCSSAPAVDLPYATGTVNWFGLFSRYFTAVVIPQGFTGDKIYWDGRKTSSGHRTMMSIPVSSIAPKEVVEKSFKICIAEKKKDILVSVDPNIKDATDSSKWIEPIRVIFMWVLLKIYSLLGNFGWAIIVMSIFTKLIFLPLTQKSTESMKKMSALGPKMNEIKAKYKDKPDVIQKETMKLYKEHGVNPMGGCLPMLIQMPFFIALYSALSNSLDMWQAPFMLWMQDLSMPDTVGVISGFKINILPIIMVITTLLQQKFSGMDAAQQNNKMMKFLPLFFLFIFWNMPSGLILYWIVQNVLQVGHQLYVNNKKKSAKEA